jgi:hypothetical protein
MRGTLPPLRVKKNRDPQSLIKPIRMDPDDDSGTPVALIELARRTGRLRLVDEVDPEDVLIEFRMGPLPARQLGATRFVRLREGGYALVR